MDDKEFGTWVKRHSKNGADPSNLDAVRNILNELRVTPLSEADRVALEEQLRAAHTTSGLSEVHDGMIKSFRGDWAAAGSSAFVSSVKKTKTEEDKRKAMIEKSMASEDKINKILVQLLSVNLTELSPKEKKELVARFSGAVGVFRGAESAPSTAPAPKVPPKKEEQKKVVVPKGLDPAIQKELKALQKKATDAAHKVSAAKKAQGGADLAANHEDVITLVACKEEVRKFREKHGLLTEGKGKE